MKKKTLWKDIRKCFSKSRGRFFSILGLVALGSFALVGLQVAGPDMRKTGETYFKSLKLVDISIIGDYGIDAENQEAISRVSGAKKIEYGYLKDVVIAGTDTSIRVFSETEGISEYEVTDGRMPEKEDEIAVASYLSDQYAIGDTIKFSEKANAAGDTVLKHHRLKIVGFVNSGELLSIINMGQSTAGTGELQGYAVVTKEAFDSEVYMIARLSFCDTDGVDPYSGEYTDLIGAHKEELNTLLADQPSARLASIKKEYQGKIDEAQTEIDDAKNRLADTLAQLNEGEQEIAEAKQAYSDGLSEYETKKAQAEEQLKAAAEQIASAETQISNAEASLSAKREELQLAKNELAGARTTLDMKWAEYQEREAQTGTDAQSAAEQLAGAKAELESGEANYAAKQGEIEAAGAQLEAAEAELSQKKQELAAAKTEYAGKRTEADQELADAKNRLDVSAAQIADGENVLVAKWAEYNGKRPEAEEKIAEAEEKIADAKSALGRLKQPVYALDTRREIPGAEGYRIYGSVSNIVDALADVFPVFLYFVAALVTLTTMTRFVDEERVNSGTLKALGYTNRDIVKKFVVYGFSAGMTGAVLGVAAGHTLLPLIVCNAYGHSFTYPKIELHFYPGVTAVALLLALLCTVVPAFVAANRTLAEKPAALLQPKPPESGSKIFLERITPLWNSMSFTHKVTARNLFRYKKRMLMTIFGVCGSVTLIFAGFSVQHSISGVKNRQFGTIMNYDLIVAKNDNPDEEQSREIDTLLASEKIKSQIPVHYETITKIAGNHNDAQEIKLIVPEEAKVLSKYITLADRKTGRKIALSDDGCVITERLARLLDIGVGDGFTFTDEQQREHTVTVAAVTEMYTGHFAFMNPSCYESAFSKSYTSNANLVTLKDRSSDSAKRMASRFIELDGVAGVVQNTTLTNQIDTIVHSLNKIMQILIIVAMLLAVVILYNLTNINISERVRELSTIRVLGFYDREVTMYIYRETILLTLIGILAGFVSGDILYRYIIEVVPPDEVMFNPALGARAFIVPVVVIAVLTAALGVMMNRRLKKVDMLEALKSVE